MSVITVLRRLVVDLLEEAILATCVRVKMFDPPPSSPSPVSPHCSSQALPKTTFYDLGHLVPSKCTDSRTPMARTRNRLPELTKFLHSTRFPTKSRHRLERVISHQMCLHTGSAWTQATNPELVFCHPS